MNLRALLPYLVATACALSALPAGSASADSDSTYERQPVHDRALFRVNAPNNAAAQAVRTDDATVGNLAAYIVNQGTQGSLTLSLRTDYSDPSTTVAAASADLAELGGWGEGWVELPLESAAHVDAGSTYYLVVSAAGADGPVIWNGARSDLPAALPAYNYDVSYWGGWHAYVEAPYDTFHPAFALNASGDDSCAGRGDCFHATPRPAPSLPLAGVTGNDEATVGITPQDAEGARYVAGSTVLELPDGRLRYVPDGSAAAVTVPADDPGARGRVAADRAWLAAGTVPGSTAEQRAIAARALLNIHVLDQPNGAPVVAWYGAWKYAWPRDGSFMAAALAQTGHRDEAYDVLRFMASVQRPDGTWEARYLPDGSGPPDGRPWQLDGNGWVPFAADLWLRTADDDAHTQQQARALWPAVRDAADYVTEHLGPDGMPPATPDYWENAVQGVTIGLAAPLLSGLRSSAHFAAATGHVGRSREYAAAAARLGSAIDRDFGGTGYGRYPWAGSGADSAVTFLTPPFAPSSRQVDAAVRHAATALTLPVGGILPGEAWTGDPNDAWTPETAFFALSAAAAGRDAEAERWLAWLADHRTTLGVMPEKVRDDGLPLSVAPLGWTDAIVLLALTGLDGDLLDPPAVPDQSQPSP
jgi:glucoamylase